MADLLSTDDYSQIMRGETTTAIALSLASGLVRAYCGWELSQETDVTVDLDSDGGRVLLLPSLCVTKVSALTLAGASLSPSDWEWRRNGSLLWAPQGRFGGRGGWPRGSRLVSVTYDSGYETIPDALRAVVASVAQRVGVDGTVTQHLENTGGIQTNTTFSTAATQGAGLTLVEKAALDRYRIVSVR